MRDLSVDVQLQPSDHYQHRALPPEPSQTPTATQNHHQQQQQGHSQTHHTGSNNISSAAPVRTIADTSKSSTTTTPTAAATNAFELVPFIEQLWEGYNVKVVYSTKPLVEKNRVLYLRAGTEKGNKLIRERLLPIGTEVTEAQREYTHKLLVDTITTTGTSATTTSITTLNATTTSSTGTTTSVAPLQLCWGRRGMIGSISYSTDKCLDLDTIKHIKVGSGIWSQCVNIGSTSGRVLVLRIENETVFHKILAGITLIVEQRKGLNTTTTTTTTSSPSTPKYH